jgi:sec-independent protein translocase protein TatA
MQPSIWQILIIGALVLILFGRGRISEMMGDVGKGIKSFKQGISEEEKSSENPQRIDSKPTDINAETTTRSDKTAG